MKKLPFLFYFVLGLFNLQAQLITITPEYSENIFENVNLDDWHALPIELDVTNNTANELSLKWVLAISEDCPMSWEYSISDNFNDFAPMVNTNYDPSQGINLPFVLQPNEISSHFAFHIWIMANNDPQPGCCTAKVHFYEIANQDSLIATAVMDLSVNKPNCFTSTFEIGDENSIKIFPNPASDFFSLSANDEIERIEIYNTLGQVMKVFNSNTANIYDVADLPKGSYFLGLFDGNDFKISTVKFQKGT